MLRQMLSSVAKQSWMRKMAMSTPGIRDLAWRFVAGENVNAAMMALGLLQARGIKATLNYVGTHAHEAAETERATRAALECLSLMKSGSCEPNISVKLTLLGLDIDEKLCIQNIVQILDHANQVKGFVCIDMEEFRYVDATLKIFQELFDKYGPSVGIVLQSYLHRTRADLERICGQGVSIRIVKGGYWETSEGVYRRKMDIDEAFSRDVDYLLEYGKKPSIATHDPKVIQNVREHCIKKNYDPEKFEFQMLYGVAEKLQLSLIQEGYSVRSYVPYGNGWYEYFLGCLRRTPSSIFSTLSGQSSRWGDA